MVSPYGHEGSAPYFNKSKRQSIADAIQRLTEGKDMKNICKLSVGFLLLLMIGCAPAVIGAGATGGYKVVTDERSVGRIWKDSNITTKINAGLIKDPMVKTRKIDIDTIDGHVILTGIVQTEKEAQRAVAIARRVPGVKKITRNIQVGSRSFGQAVDDQLLGNRIKAKLIAEPGIRSLNIDVDVAKRVVTLSGIVDSLVQKRKIIEITKTTPRIIKVVDFIKVKTP